MQTPTHTEILIIGGGIAGVSTAYYVAKQGHEVILLEQNEQLASEASGLNAGTLWPTGGPPFADLPSTLSMGSLEILKMLQLDHGYDIEFRQCGALKAYRTIDEFQHANGLVRWLKPKGHKLKWLNIREARCLQPGLNPQVMGCLYYPLAAQANPVKTTQAIATEAEREGVNFSLNQKVTAIASLDDGTYKVTTSQGIFQAETLVIAAGPWSRPLGEMLGLHIPVFAVRGQMWSTGPVPPCLFTTIGAMESVEYWRQHQDDSDTTPKELTHHGAVRLTRHLYGGQTKSGEIIFGGDRQLSSEKTPDSAGIEANYHHACEILPFLREFPIKRTWAGLMPFTRNMDPIIGKLPQYENLYVLTGLGPSGFEQGPMSGWLLAQYIDSGVMPALLADADPARQVTVSGT